MLLRARREAQRRAASRCRTARRVDHSCRGGRGRCDTRVRASGICAGRYSRGRGSGAAGTHSGTTSSACAKRKSCISAAATTDAAASGVGARTARRDAARASRAARKGADVADDDATDDGDDPLEHAEEASSDDSMHSAQSVPATTESTAHPDLLPPLRDCEHRCQERADCANRHGSVA